MRRKIVLIVVLSLAGCSRPREAPVTSAPKPITIQAPLGLPPVPIPADNPLTAEAVFLGRNLFFSKALSADGTISCATCHDPAHGFADPRPVSTGVGGAKGMRNAPTVLNAAWSRQQFWDGRAPTLEAQASGPMLNMLEMAHDPVAIERICNQDSNLRAAFDRAYGAEPATMDRIKKAIAAFERTLVSGNSAFDRFQYGGDKSALSPAAQRGLAVFQDPARGNCVACHTIGSKYALFTDLGYHNVGAGLDPQGEIVDQGRFAQTNREADRGAFRTPSLRNVALTAPYMHDGSLKSLKEVVDFYVGGGSSNPYLDPLIKPLTHLTRQERADLVSFLESLTGEMPPIP